MQKVVLVIFLFFTSLFSKAQELESILLAADDASKLTQSYIAPVLKGLMYNMNGGWYHTARTHQKLGFDLTINANMSFVPDADKVFELIQNEYAFLSLPNGETSLPTVFGSDEETTVAVSVPIPNENNRFKVADFNMPGGVASDLPVNAVPTPMVQLGFGLPQKTDLKLRFVPNLNFNDVETNLIGIGVQHDLIQYFREPNFLPLYVSLLAAFTNMNLKYNINGEGIDNIDVVGGSAEFKLNTWTIQLLGSLNYKRFTIYTSIGYNNGSSSIDVKGNYNLTYDVEDANGNAVGASVEELVQDPINLNFDATGARATVGGRLNLGVFRIFGDYTLQEYNTLSAGIAFSFN